MRERDGSKRGLQQVREPTLTLYLGKNPKISQAICFKSFALLFALIIEEVL